MLEVMKRCQPRGWFGAWAPACQGVRPGLDTARAGRSRWGSCDVCPPTTVPTTWWA